MSDIHSAELPSISDSLASASSSVAEIDQELSTALPNPISVDNIDHTKKEKTEPEKRRDALTSARKKVEAKDADEKKAAKAEANRDPKGKFANDDTPKVSNDINENRHLLRGIIGKHLGHGTDKISPKELNTKEVREARAELRHRYPNANLGELFDMFEKWDEAYQRDPVGARETLMEHYLRMGPQNFAKGRPAEHEAGLRGSMKRAADDQKDFSELEPYIDKYGKAFPHLLRQLLEYDRDMVADPVRTSARLAANYGAPVSDRQAEQYLAQQGQQQQEQQRQEYLQHIVATKPHAHQRTPEEDYACVEESIRLTVKHCNDPSVNMPGLEREEVLNAVAVAMECNVVPFTGDRMQNLRDAHKYVMEIDAQLKGVTNAGNQRSIDRGGKSIKGAPSQNGSIGGRRGSNSIHAALERARAAS